MELWLFLTGLLVIFMVTITVHYALGRAPAPAPAQSEDQMKHEEKNEHRDVSGQSIKVEYPYSTKPINSVDDYEHNLVFMNEGDRAMTKQTRDFLMSKYPMDWSTQPPSSDMFQQGLQAYKEGFENAEPLPPTKRYNAIDGTNMTPPDSLGQEMKEREILQTYVPKDPKSLTTYDAEDAKAIIDKIYSAKGLIPTYTQSGDNQFIVTSTRPVNQPIVYEEDATEVPASNGPVQSAGEDTISVPLIQPTGGLDPFFTPGEKTRDGPWNYEKWTPGLERMFAPTAPMKNWY
jgi:hypothetical protein